MTRLDQTALVILLALLAACAPKAPERRIIPAIEYANRVRSAGNDPRVAYGVAPSHAGFVSPASITEPKARLRYAADGSASPDAAGGTQNEPEYYVERAAEPEKRDYNGPLSLGDPGVTASLWRESRASSELFRDYRAWQPMDLITIVVSESSEGKKEADTEVKESSSILASIENLLGLENSSIVPDNNLDLDALVKASSQNDYKGEGETTRKDSLKARISAMVVEVLPSGILRIEGERIIAVNNEEQTMVISGLVRQRDISSSNEVDSSKIANLRIDYFGRGTVGEAQTQGWMGRTIRKLWPF